MAITVKFVGAFRHSSGAGELEIGCRGLTSVIDLVNELVRKVPELEHSLIDQQLGNPGPNALILVNGREIGVLDGLETRLKDGDEVVLVPVVHGG
jgi:molybdopterin synthase sulfur carrier subunit